MNFDSLRQKSSRKVIQLHNNRAGIRLMYTVSLKKHVTTFSQ